ncbi:hypothetical protein DIPPA_27153 [Diplonema papillatum]|nr:hypothetical protein DIPPA_27153 [Diplonema papillatum]|eukprot:gene20001-30778_t
MGAIDLEELLKNVDKAVAIVADDTAETTAATPPSLEDAVTDDDRLRAVEAMIFDMFIYMDNGELMHWAEKCLSEQVHFVISGLISDPAEDGVGIGRQCFLQWYNNMLTTAGKMPPMWDIKQDVHMLSKETFQIFWYHIVDAGTDREYEKRTQYILSMRMGKIYYMRISAWAPDNNMNAPLLALRSYLPPTETAAPAPPCTHNSWESMRAKHSHTVLKCRGCGATWRMHASISHLYRCYEFLAARCPAEPGGCKRIHVHPRKRRAHEYKEGDPVALAAPAAVEEEENGAEDKAPGAIEKVGAFGENAKVVDVTARQKRR